MPSGRKRSYASRFSKKAKSKFTRSKRTRFRRRKALPRRAKPVKMFPKKQLVELTYCDTVTIPSVSAGSAPYKFRLNSIHDPDWTATGHQPRGHDQWAQIYKRYCVIGAKVLVEPLLNLSTPEVDCTLFSYIDDDNTSDIYNVQILRELGMPKTTHKYVELGQDPKGVRRYKNPNLSFKVGMKKFFGIGKNTQIMTPAALGAGDNGTSPLDPHGMSALMGADPTSVCYLKIHNETHGSDNIAIKARVTIKYVCVLHDPVEIGGS